MGYALPAIVGSYYVNQKISHNIGNWRRINYDEFTGIRDIKIS